MAEGTISAPAERRASHVLREVLDELIDHVRGISSRGGELSDEQIEYAQQRLEWLADEVWQLALKGDEAGG